MFLGLRYLPALIVSFVITDLVIGYHTGTYWTWGSVILIGLIAPVFAKNFNTRLGGALLSASIFFLITNFGVWSTGLYGYTFDGFLTCYILAIPFFTYSLISTFAFFISN